MGVMAHGVYRGIIVCSPVVQKEYEHESEASAYRAIPSSVPTDTQATCPSMNES